MVTSHCHNACCWRTTLLEHRTKLNCQMLAVGSKFTPPNLHATSVVFAESHTPLSNNLSPVRGTSTISDHISVHRKACHFTKQCVLPRIHFHRGPLTSTCMIIKRQLTIAISFTWKLLEIFEMLVSRYTDLVETIDDSLPKLHSLSHFICGPAQIIYISPMP